MSSQPSAQRGRPVLLGLLAQRPYLWGLPSSFLPLLAFPLPMVPPSSAPIEHPALVIRPYSNILEPDLAIISLDSIALDVQILPSPSVGFSARVAAINDLPPSLGFNDWDSSFGWESCLCGPYQLRTVTPPTTAILSGRRYYWDVDGNKIIVSVNSRDEVLPPVPVFQYAAAFFARLDVRRFVLGKRLDGYAFLIQVDRCQMPRPCRDWLRRWIHFGGHGAAWLWTYG